MKTKTEIETEYQKALNEGNALHAVAMLDTYYFLVPPTTLKYMELLAAARRAAT